MTRFLVMSPAPRHLSVWTARRVLLHMVHPTWASCCTCLGGPGALYGQWKHWNLSASGGAQPRDFMAEGQRGSSSAAPACCGNMGSGSVPQQGCPSAPVAGPTPGCPWGISISQAPPCPVLLWELLPQANPYSGLFFDRTVPAVTVNSVFLAVKSKKYCMRNNWKLMLFFVLAETRVESFTQYNYWGTWKQFTCFYLFWLILHFCFWTCFSAYKLSN